MPNRGNNPVIFMLINGWRQYSPLRKDDVEMAFEKNSLMDLQLFAEDISPAETITEPTEVVEQPAELTPDSVESMWENIGKEPAEPVKEPVKEEPQDIEPEQKQETPKEPEPTKTDPDFSQVVKFKENGQEVELTLAQLIDRAQKGSNYERKVQELVTKQKAFETALQQKPPEQPKPEDKIKSLQQQVNDYRTQFQNEYGIEFNEYDPTHMAAFFDARTQQKAQELLQKQSKEAQFKEYDSQEKRYADVINQNAADKNFEKINEFALQSLFALPQKGTDGIREFESLYPVFQKIQQRVNWQNDHNTKVDPFNANEVDSISKFFDSCKKEYYAKQFVPKTPEKKQTVKTETPGSGEQVPKQFDINRFAKADKETQEKVYEAYYNKMTKG